MRHPGHLFREMFRDLWASRELAWRLFIRDMSSRYRQSVLGYVWAFLPSIVSTCTFVLLGKSGILGRSDPRMPYPIFVLIGMLLWQAFADAITSPNKAVSGGRPMLAKINFPREALLIAGVLEVVFNLLIRFALLAPVCVYYRIVPPPMTALLAVFGIAAIVCLGFMIGLLLTPVGLLYADVNQALSLGLTFWMLISPVIYVPPSTGVLAVLTKINPVSPLILSTREWLTVGGVSQLVPSLLIFAGTQVFLVIGWVLYRLAMPILVERMGN